jgi:hypothetical protein
MITGTTTVKTTDTNHTLWRKILQKYQNRLGASSDDTLRLADTRRRLKLKILRAQKGL